MGLECDAANAVKMERPFSQQQPQPVALLSPDSVSSPTIYVSSVPDHQYNNTSFDLNNQRFGQGHHHHSSSLSDASSSTAFSGGPGGGAGTARSLMSSGYHNQPQAHHMDREQLEIKGSPVSDSGGISTGIPTLQAVGESLPSTSTSTSIHHNHNRQRHASDLNGGLGGSGSTGSRRTNAEEDRDSSRSLSTASPSAEHQKKKQKRNKPTLSCFECVERKTKVSFWLCYLAFNWIVQLFHRAGMQLALGRMWVLGVVCGCIDFQFVRCLPSLTLHLPCTWVRDTLEHPTESITFPQCDRGRPNCLACELSHFHS